MRGLMASIGHSAEQPTPQSLETGRKTAHEFNSKVRTKDVHLDDKVTFAEMGLSVDLQKGLFKAGFERPSPIQISAIPYGRCGLDLVVQAKSGTGKTCVFTIIILEAIDLDVKSPQVLVLAPTREIALQIEQVISSIGSNLSGLVCHCSIGGLSLKQDMERVKKAHVVVGTPGRIKQLVELSALNCNSIRLFVLDEADKLLDSSFQEQINWIYSGLPESKQLIAASATYSEDLVKHLCNYMHNPTFVRLNSNDPALLGVRQYKLLVPISNSNLPNEEYNNKVKALVSILSRLNFQQCLIFSNLMSRAENLSRLMMARGWPTAHIAGCQDQDERILAITKLKAYDCRILVSTDLTSRGIDADRIDLVINLDLPYDSETYLHRVGRAGRFGAKGAAITLFSQKEEDKLNEIAIRIKTNIPPLPDSFSADLIERPSYDESTTGQVVQVESFQIVTSPTSTADNHWTSTKDKYVADWVQSFNKGNNNEELNLTETEQVANKITDEVLEVSLTDKDDNKQVCVTAEPVGNQSDGGDILSHRPPFASLQEALDFLADPDGCSHMLETTRYKDRLNVTPPTVSTRVKESVAETEITDTAAILSSDVKFCTESQNVPVPSTINKISANSHTENHPRVSRTVVNPANLRPTENELVLNLTDIDQTETHPETKTYAKKTETIAGQPGTCSENMETSSWCTKTLPRQAKTSAVHPEASSGKTANPSIISCSSSSHIEKSSQPWKYKYKTKDTTDKAVKNTGLPTTSHSNHVSTQTEPDQEQQDSYYNYYDYYSAGQTETGWHYQPNDTTPLCGRCGGTGYATSFALSYYHTSHSYNPYHQRLRQTLNSHYQKVYFLTSYIRQMSVKK